MTEQLTSDSPGGALPLPILYQDDDLCIVNKPSGLAVHPGWAPERDTALSRAAATTGRYVYPVHRLDRATSGVLVFAFSSEMTRVMQASMQQPVEAVSGADVPVKHRSDADASRKVLKLYLALVRGIAPDCGTIDHPLAKSKEHEKRPSFTQFQRLASYERYSLVRARPLTGRLHQIRRHMKFLCHPLIGDTSYGKGEHNRIFRERFNLQRLALHAAQLHFPHPRSGAAMVVSAPLPEDLATPLAALGLLTAAEQGCFSEWPSDASDWRVFSDLTRPVKA